MIEEAHLRAHQVLKDRGRAAPPFGDPHRARDDRQGSVPAAARGRLEEEVFEEAPAAEAEEKPSRERKPAPKPKPFPVPGAMMQPPPPDPAKPQTACLAESLTTFGDGMPGGAPRRAARVSRRFLSRGPVAKRAKPVSPP